ncbi:MAG: MaoC/PaaZ C-terminal domain-containing protein [Actinomycetota bacterium]|nr:MaoC/PaaZ C-terminal domain-containing protein [Actinomycetota bacterium]
MPIDLAVVGKELDSMEFAFEKKDVILYALGVGAGYDADELKFVYENGLEALPTFGVVPPFPALMGLVAVEGIDINLVMLVHGEQYLEIRKPIPAGGKLITKPKIAAVWDKTKGAVIELDADTVDESGEVVFYNKFSSFIRGEGGFGGERGPEPGNEPPERDPDKVVEMKTLTIQAMIYRLSGDYNPLHIDPNFAGMAGFDRPILHGLCTFGHAGRAVLREYCDNDPAKFKAIKVRFSRPVWPGDTIITQMWKEENDKIVFRCTTKERPEEYCITNAAVWLNT